LGEHGLLIIRLFGKRMLGDHITLTGGTHGHPPTYPQGPLRGQLIGPDHLHQVHVHVRWGIHLVGDPFPVGNFDLYVTHTIGVRTGPWTGSRSCSLMVNQWILQQPWRLPSGCRRSLSPPPRWYISSHIFYRDGSVDRHFGTSGWPRGTRKGSISASRDRCSHPLWHKCPGHWSDSPGHCPPGWRS